MIGVSRAVAALGAASRLSRLLPILDLDSQAPLLAFPFAHGDDLHH